MSGVKISGQNEGGGPGRFKETRFFEFQEKVFAASVNVPVTRFYEVQLYPIA